MWAGKGDSVEKSSVTRRQQRDNVTGDLTMGLLDGSDTVEKLGDSRVLAFLVHHRLDLGNKSLFVRRVELHAHCQRFLALNFLEGAPQRLLVFERVDRRLLDDFLQRLLQRIPTRGRHDQHVRHDLMLGFGVELADFPMTPVGQRSNVVLGSVNNTGLQRRIDFAPRHRGRRRTNRLDHLDRRRALLHADLHPFQVIRRVDRLLGVEAAGARIVVGKADEQIQRTDGELIPQMELVCPPQIAENYEQLMSEQKWIACAEKIGQIPSIFIQSWKSNLLTERLQHKMQAIENYLELTNQHWEEAFYITLARNFGFGKNTDAFEKLAKSVPLSILGKHKDNLFQLEALLFGQSGLLDVAYGEYPEQLRKEYTFLKNKYELNALQPIEWKLLRLRPDNFPHVRIAQFAALVHSSSKLFSKIIEQAESEKIRALLTCEPSEYWTTHYLFGDESKPKSKKPGTESINSILINTIVPSIFCYAGRKGSDSLKEKALQILESIPAEKNAIIEGWKILGLEADNAFDSQALIQLKKNYCEERNCLRCRIGHKVLSLQNG